MVVFGYRALHDPPWGHGVGLKDAATWSRSGYIPEGHGHTDDIYDIRGGIEHPCRIAAVGSRGESARAWTYSLRAKACHSPD